MNLNLDIRSAVITATVISALLSVFLLWRGVRALQQGRTMKFFRMRRDRILAGWRMLFLAVLLAVIAIVVNRLAEPVVYSFFPPTPTLTQSPTITITPSITLTPTITLSPTITDTPSQTDTPTPSPTPHIPLAIEVLFTSETTPSPETAFSPLIFATSLDGEFQPVNPDTVFQNPVGHLYAWFSFDKMTLGSQWTALWLRNSELVHFETSPWSGSTGGYGYTDWNPAAQEWLPGTYEVQLFVGLEWKVSGIFTVEGEAPTPAPSATSTSTRTPTATATGTRTPLPTASPSATASGTPTFGPSPTATPLPPSSTPRPSATRAPTFTLTAPAATRTRAPTLTPVLPTATNTRAPTATP